MRRSRNFRRISMTAKMAKFIQEGLVNKTFNDHHEKCSALVPFGADIPSGIGCPHEIRRSLQVAQVLDAGLHIGKKRAHLDIPCPYLGDVDAEDHIKTLEVLVKRLRAFSSNLPTNRSRLAMHEVARQVEEYAQRNAMEVIAESSI